MEKEPPAPRSIQFMENSIGAPPPGTMPATKSRASTGKTSAGSAGMDVMISCWPTVCTGLPLASDRGHFVHVHGPSRAEHGEHYSKSDRDLRGRYGNHQHRVTYPEPPGTGKVIREGDERQVHAVYHQLHAHKNHDGVAPDQSPPGTDSEEESTNNQITL